MKVDDCIGTISLYYKGELIDRRRYRENYYLLCKSYIIQQWKYRYGKKYYDKNVVIKSEVDL